MRLIHAARVLALCVGSASASAFVPWANANMRSSWFTVFNGGSDNGLYGSPTMDAFGILRFYPDFFTATAVNGATTITADRMSFFLTVDPGPTLTSISLTEAGTFALAGAGQVDVDTLVRLTNFGTLNGNVPAEAYIGATWSNSLTISIGAFWNPGDTIQVEIFNTLTATTFSLGDSATITKTQISREDIPAVTIAIVPAPAAGGILLLPIFTVRRRRR